MSRIGKELWRQIELGHFETPCDVWSFAFRVSFHSVIITSLAGFCLLPIIYAAEVVTIPFSELVTLMVAFSWLFAGVISGGLAWVVGHVIRDLLRSRREFERLSRTDTLSGLANRRAFNDAFASIDGEASLVIIDIDRFKSINDRFGHQAGDRVIQAISAVLKDVFREPHLVARLGGEEFGVILRGKALAERLALVEQARQRIADHSIRFHDVEFGVTISAGVAEFRAGRRWEITYAFADKALYLAKDAGRDRVFHEESLALIPSAQADHAADDTHLFAVIGRRS